jgi:hypothetical protein
MTKAEGQADAIQAIVRIVRDQKALESHQRAKGASVNTLQDSMVYAYDQIVEVIRPFMDHDR